MQDKDAYSLFAEPYRQVRDAASVAAWSLQGHVVSTLVHNTPGPVHRCERRLWAPLARKVAVLEET